MENNTQQAQGTQLEGVQANATQLQQQENNASKAPLSVPSVTIPPNTENNTGEPKTEPKTKPVEFSPEQQKEIDRIIAERLIRQATKSEQEKNEAKRLASLSAEEKAQEQLNSLSKKLEEIEKQNTFYTMKDEANKIFSDNGIKNIDDNIAKMVVCSTAEETLEKTTAFIELVNKVADEKLAEKLKGKPLNVTGQTDLSKTNTLTQKEIFSIKNNAERKKAIEDNIEIFK